MSLEKMAPNEYAKKYLEQSEPLAVHLISNNVFEYRDGVWNRLIDNELLRRVADFFNNHETAYSPHKIKSVAEAIKMQMDINDEWGLRADWCKANSLSSYDTIFWKCSLIGVQQNITYDELMKKYDISDIEEYKVINDCNS